MKTKLLLFFIFCGVLSFGQVIYQHDFGTIAITTTNYTVAPTTFATNLNSSSWTNSIGAFTSFGGSSGQALSLSNSSGNPTISLTFNVASGFQLNIASFDFWRQRSTSGAQNWSMTINGIAVGNGTVPTAGAAIVTTAVSNAVNNLTGTITMVLSLSGASGSGTFRLDDFTFNGNITPIGPVVPTITSALTKTAVYGTADSYNITVSGSPTSFSTGVLPSGFTLSGSTITKANNVDAGNYTIAISATNANGTDTKNLIYTVSPLPLTITGLTGTNKIYDGATTAALTGTASLSGVLFSDNVILSGTATSNFTDKNVGTGKTITTSGYSLSGTKASNYAVTQPLLLANITAKTLTISAPSIASKVYNASANSGLVTVGTISGLIGSETLGVSATGIYADANSGNGKTATVSYVLANGTNGGLATSYSLSNGTGIGDITKANAVFTTATIALNIGGTYNLPGANVASISDGVLSYGLTNNGFATLAGTTITGVSIGTETLTVNQAASTNFNAGSTTISVSVSLIAFTTNDYRTINGTGLLWTNANHWQRSNGSGGWNAAGADGTPSSIRNVYIHGSMSTNGAQNSNKIIIESGGILTVTASSTSTAQTLVKDGGILQLNAVFTNNGLFEVEYNGTLNINYATASGTASIWNGTENFHSGSLVNIQNWNYGASAAIRSLIQNPSIIDLNSAGYYFGNLTISGNLTGTFPMVSGNQTINLCKDNFLRNATGSNVFFTSSSGNITVGGNVIVTSGQLSFAATTNGIIEIYILGDLIVNGGNVNLNQNFSSAILNVNLFGDLYIGSTNTILSTNDNSLFNFTGIGNGLTALTTQTIDVANSTTASNINFNVNSGSYTKLINQDFALGTNSIFTVNTGGTLDFGFNGINALNLVRVASQTQQSFTAQVGSTLKITSKDGITSSGNYIGNVQVGANVTNRVFDAGTIYHYIGKENQVSGNGLPAGMTGKVIVELDTDAILFNASGNKTFNTAGTLEIKKGIVVDTSSDSFGDAAVNNGNLTMTGGRYRIFKGNTQPDLSGNYNLTAGVIEYAGTLSKTIRSPRTYQNIEVTGDNVGNSSGNITLNPNGTFIIKNNGANIPAAGIFNINSNAITGPLGNQTITVETGAIFRTGDSNGFNGSNNSSIKNDIENIILQNNSTVEYSRSGDQLVTLFSQAYRNLTISGTGTKTLQNPTSIRVEENLNIISSKLLLNTNEVITVRNSVNITDATGEMELKNNAQLIQIDESSLNTGTNFKAERSANVANLDYVYWSSPVENFSVSNIPDSYRYFWNPQFSNANTSVGNWNAASGIMEKGQGYIVRSSTNGNITANFFGKPNNGVFTKLIYRGDNYVTSSIPNPIGLGITKEDDNWNLVGNPYPSAISADKFLIKNAGSNSKIDGNIWIWKHGIQPTSDVNPYYDNFAANYSTTDYIKYNLLGSTPPGFNGQIASGQGFMISMLDVAGTTSTPIPNTGNTNLVTQFFTDVVSFENNMRSYDLSFAPYLNDQFYKNSNKKNQNNNSTTDEEKHRIWLDITNESVNQTETMLLGYTSNATLERDRLYDCFYTPKSEIGIYSLIVNDGFIIQGRPLPFDFNDQIPLGINIANAGNHKIAIRQVDGLFSTNQIIYVQDLYLNTIHNLNDAPYSFTSTTGKFEDRFVLRYTDGTLGINTNTAVNEIVVLAKNNSITVVSKSEDVSSIEIFDTLGKRIAIQLNINSNQFIFDSVTATKQALLVKIKLVNGSEKVQKVIL